MELENPIFKIISILTDSIALFSAVSAIIYGILNQTKTQFGFTIIKIVSIIVKIILTIFILALLFIFTEFLMLFINAFTRDIIPQFYIIFGISARLLSQYILFWSLFTILGFLISSILWTRSLNTIKTFLNFLLPIDYQINLIHEKALNVISAKYGAEKSFIDATEILRRMIQSNRLTITASNDIAGDPIYGIQKVLKLSYQYEGEDQISLEINEGQTRKIKPLKS
ncbi:hypothetical protein EHQ94_01955 [Leptospira meyeri]|uniref:hypothetical protein n=1 Tax=Leptospira meyeri TaxID=29508 RepID=UPI001082F08F|nr:hypothetical protein [Leptospira meyeri]TGM60081.1 hypothetical protein EHQ93_18100 [Leptospira meyeri]TGM72086.1 hypothetical protein EHQ94_01955 [Leptospira meyeri]